MFCSKCGVENNDVAKFCKECGESLEKYNTVPATEINTSSKIATNNPPKSVLLYALAPIGFFIALVVLFGIINLFADAENPSSFVLFINSTLIPLLFVLTFLAIPVGIIYAIYTNSKNYDGTIKCGSCTYVGKGRKGRSIWAQVMVWLLFPFFWPITLVYYLVTHGYFCPKCNSTFIGLKDKSGTYSAPRNGLGALGVILIIFLFIGIIGILASIVLASLNTARDKGQDAAVKSTLSSVRAQADIYYDDNLNSYKGLCNNKKIARLLDQTFGYNKVNYVCNDNASAYAVTGPLNEGGYYCADSKDNETEIDYQPPLQTYCSKTSDSVSDTYNQLNKANETESSQEIRYGNTVEAGNGKITILNQPSGSVIKLQSATFPINEGWLAVRTYDNEQLGVIIGAVRFSKTQGLVPTTIQTLSPMQPGNNYALVFFTENGDKIFSLEDDLQLDNYIAPFSVY